MRQHASLTMRVTVRIVLLFLVVLGIQPQATADDPGWYERYLFNVICARQSRCVAVDQVPSQLAAYLLGIYRPLHAASSIDDAIGLFITLERSPNAWALKHYTGVTTGLLQLSPTKDELAFVAAHELAHIELGHYQAKMNEVSKYYVVAAIFILLSQGNYNPLNDPFYVTVARLGLAAYSREQEAAADVRGVQLMNSAGFDPGAAVSLLARLGSLGRQGTGDLFDDHPSIERRIGRIRTELANLPRPSVTPPSATSVARETHEIIPGTRIGSLSLGMTVDEAVSAMQRRYDDNGRSSDDRAAFYRWYLDESAYTSVLGRPRIVMWVVDGSTRTTEIQVYARQFRTPGGNGVGDQAEAFYREFGEAVSVSTPASGETVWRFRSNLFIGFDPSSGVVGRVGVHLR